MQIGILLSEPSDEQGTVLILQPLHLPKSSSSSQARRPRPRSRSSTRRPLSPKPAAVEQSRSLLLYAFPGWICPSNPTLPFKLAPLISSAAFGIWLMRYLVTWAGDLSAGGEGSDMATAFKAFVNSPVGPKTTHFWGPVANWGFVLAVSAPCLHRFCT